MLLVIRCGRWILWLGFRRQWPYEMGAGLEENDELSFGLTLEIV